MILYVKSYQSLFQTIVFIYFNFVNLAPDKHLFTKEKGAYLMIYLLIGQVKNDGKSINIIKTYLHDVFGRYNSLELA